VSTVAADLEVRFARRSFPLAWLAAPAALGISRLLPAEGIGLGLRLAAATACLLLPGALVARALALDGLAPAFVWTLAALFGGLTIMFTVHGSLWLAIAVMGAVGLCAAPFAFRRPGVRIPAWSLGVLALGIVAGITLWWVAAWGGDAFFHLARVRKLVDFGSISLKSLDEYKDGGLHPGYAFPLWHGALAVVAKLAGVDPSEVVLHGPTVLLPLFFVLTYESGLALFRSRWAGIATMLAQFALLGLASGHGGALVFLTSPSSPTFNGWRMLALPALLALFFAYVRNPSWALLASVAAASGAVTLIHPPDAVLMLILLFGFLVARALLARKDVGEIATALAAAALPAVLVITWLLPIIRQTVSHKPGAAEAHRAFAHYARELDVFGLHSYRLRPELFGRVGAIAIAAIVLVPLALLARRRLWAAFVLGGVLMAYAFALLPFLFPQLADAISISAARRIIGFSPRAFALVGGALVLARLLGPFVLPVGLAAGIALQLAMPGDFSAPYRHLHGSPGWLTWASFAAAGAALVAGTFAGRRLPAIALTHRGPLAAGAVALFLLPVAIHGYSHWSPPHSTEKPLPPGLVQALRQRLPERAVVFTDAQTGYELAAFVPVYVNATPPNHSSATRANHPALRVRDAQRFFRHGGPLSIPRRYGAGWLLLDRARYPRRTFSLQQAYTDGRYVLYRLP
jgi:hypothetical protein